MAQENSDASARGAFIFINDILCLSSTEDGQFRPSDVFGRQELTSSKAPALDCLASRQQQWGDPASPRRSAYTNYISTHEGADIKTLVKAAKELGGFDMDCPIFHAFGVLSGGVLMDPVGSTVVDVGDESAATPATFSCLSDNKEIQRKYEQQRKSNHSLFLEGRTDEVKAEAAWVLASSRQPLERSPSLPFDRGLQGEAAPRSEFDGKISVRADERCRALWSRCGPLGAKFPTTSSKESDDAQHDVAIRWMHLEEFRRYAHCDYGGDAWITSDYADYYSYQYGGTYPTRLVGDQPLTKREDEDDVGVVHSPASPNTSFTCFAGRSARSYAPTYMKAWGRARVRFLRWNLRKHSQDGKPDFVPLRPPTMGELCAAYHHRPYRTRWQTFWIVFARFFPFLGIRRSSSAKEYSFHDASGNPIPFSARECLRASIVKTTSEKQQVEQKMIKRKRSREEMKNEPTQDESTANVFTAWQYLHLHELPELERRMAKLVRYLSNHMPQYQS